ncbi:hypothetical protein [Salinisphaera sp. SPP-AMP-43]|uniref:hypothetical protein n=1 Tax=Salinisphaera sp. SPP-AMP-43 TaxID=3121288 RepID=UPI003C6E334A
MLDTLSRAAERIRIVTPPHEQATAAMTPRQGRVSGRPGLCTVKIRLGSAEAD